MAQPPICSTNREIPMFFSLEEVFDMSCYKRTNLALSGSKIPLKCKFRCQKFNLRIFHFLAKNSNLEFLAPKSSQIKPQDHR